MWPVNFIATERGTLARSRFRTAVRRDHPGFHDGPNQDTQPFGVNEETEPTPLLRPYLKIL